LHILKKKKKLFFFLSFNTHFSLSRPNVYLFSFFFLIKVSFSLGQ